MADFDATWVSYSEREEFSDVIPIFPSQSESAVVAISYSPKFREVFAYLRTFLSRDERSERAFTVTTDAVRLNPANYTLWQFRRVLLKSLSKDFDAELAFTGTVIEDNPKNYQVWHHRKVLVEWKENAGKELAFTEKILKDDAKNYHAWQHRQWVVEHFGLWENELDYSSHLLAEDLRNNSAWNYRYFVISCTDGYTPDAVAREVKLTLELIKKAPHNESAWNYLSGILIDKEAACYPGIVDFCKELYETQKCRSPHLLYFMLDCLTEEATRSKQSGDSEAGRNNLDEAARLLDELLEVDPVRKEYWKFLKNNLNCQQEA